MCLAKGQYLDQVIDPLFDSKDRNKICVYNYEKKSNVQFELFYLSCGSKFISKRNGGNTQAKLTITPKITVGDVEQDGTPLIWTLTNEVDFLEDFYQDSNTFTLTVEIPAMDTEGPYNEIGCAMSSETGRG